MIGLLINKGMNGEAACYAFREIPGGRMLLVNDSGAGSKTLGPDGTVANAQCTLMSSPVPTVSETKVTFDLKLKFAPKFSGPKKVYVIAQSATGTTPGLQPVGEWIVP